MQLHQVDRIGQDREVDEAEEVELQQAERLAGVHLELGHRGLAVGRALERHDLGQRLSRDDDPGRMGRGVPRHALELLRDADELVDPIVPRHELAQRRRGLHGAVERDVQLVRDRLRDPIGLRVGEAHGASDVADGRLRAERPEGDDLRHPVVAVLAGDVLDDLVPARVLEVDVDVRHRHPVGVEEALEGEAVLERIDRRDAERVGHDAARRRSAAGDHDPLLPGEPREVGHDQEVRRVPHPVDDPELVVEPVAHLVRQRRIPLGQAALAFLAQPRALRLPVRHLEVRQPQALEVEVDLALLGDEQRVVHGVRQLAVEEAAHLRGGLQVELVVLEPHPPRRVEVRRGLDADEQVVRLVLLGVRVVRVVRRDERQVVASRQLHELRMEPALVVDPVLLDLDEEVPVAQDVAVLVGRLQRRPPRRPGRAA